MRQIAGIAPLLATHGGAGGIVERECHQALRNDLLDRLRAAAPFDGVFLALHGAMTAEDAGDVEGELLAEVRAIAGLTPIAVSCALHAHITPAMLANCDILIGYQHYPHDDAPETAARAARLVSVKNPMNYRPTYPIAAAAFVLDTKGPTTPDLRGLTWRNLARPFYP